MQAVESDREQAARTEFARAKVKQQLPMNMGYRWCTTKLRPQCLKCKARDEGITEGEAKRNLVGSRNDKPVQRANGWKKTVDNNEMNWEPSNISGYQKYLNEEGGPKDEPAFPNLDGAGGSGRADPSSDRGQQATS